MIAKYGNNIVDICLNLGKVQVWSYKFIQGFVKIVRPSGLIVYVKFVELEEIDEIFDIGYGLKWNEKVFAANLVDEKHARIFVGSKDKDFAIKHNFLEISYDRGICDTYSLIVDIDECTDFKISKTIYDKRYFEEYDESYKRREIKSISKEEWVELYIKCEYELDPNNYRN